MMFSLIEKGLFIFFAGFVFFKQTKTKMGKIFPIFVLVINLYYLIKGIAFSFITYNLWERNPLSHFLLPPYKSFGYFAHYCFFHFFRVYFFNLTFFLVLFFLMVLANKIFKGRLFYENEPYVAGLGVFLCSWPTNLFWFFLILLTGIVLHLINFFIHKKFEPKRLVSLYYLWLPLAILVIIFSKWIVGLPIIKGLIC